MPDEQENVDKAQALIAELIGLLIDCGCTKQEAEALFSLSWDAFPEPYMKARDHA